MKACALLDHSAN